MNQENAARVAELVDRKIAELRDNIRSTNQLILALVILGFVIHSCIQH